MSVADLAIVAALIFGWGTLSARLERFDVTVLLSVVAHGVTAEPLAARYARLLARRTAGQAGAEMPDIHERRLIRHTSPPQG